MTDEYGIDAVRELLQLIRDTDVTEVQIERGDVKLHIKRGSVAAPAPQAPFLVTPSLLSSLTGQSEPASSAPLAQLRPTPGYSEPPAAESSLPPNSQPIVSPMVGTFYSSPSPRDPVFVREGDEIRTGDVVGIVEAMKIMNEIETDFAGRVVRILVANGQPVEYGQTLMIVEPL